LQGRISLPEPADVPDPTEPELKAGILQEIVRTRRDRGISQKKLEQLSGVRQPVIARLEGSATDPRLTTLLRILRALGKKLVIEDI